MNKRRNAFLRLALIASLMVPCVLSAAAKIPAAQWVISTGGDNSKTSDYCAKELQLLLSHRIGKKLPVVKDGKQPSGPVILLDKTDPKLGTESFRIVRENNVIRIIGGSPIGTLYGVYEFLQRYCDVWNVAPGVIYAPKGQPLAFGDMDLTMHPAIQKRMIYHIGFYYTDPQTRKIWYEFDFRNRASRVPTVFEPYEDPKFRVSHVGQNDCHTFYDYVSPEKYGKTHPEYFSLDKSGVRNMRPNNGGQLCLSNPDVEKIVTEVMLDQIAKDRKKHGRKSPLVYDFSQLDNASYLCYCPECKKIIARYGNADSGLLLWFVNKVARTVKKKYPDVMIRTFAYVNTDKLPVGIKPDDNVLIQLCDRPGKSNHTLPLRHPINRVRRELAESWGRITKNMMIWDYIMQTGNEPLVPVDAIADDVRFFRSCNVKWIFMETEIRIENPSSFEYLKDFVLAQLYFNPDQDLNKLLDVYCRGFFGAAHKEMRAYLEHLRKAQKENPTADLEDGWNRRNLVHITPDFLRKGRAMVQKALAVNKDPKVELRILWERNVIDNALVRLLTPYPKYAAECRKMNAELLENRLKVLRAYGLRPERRKIVEEQIRLPIEENMLVFTDIPEELKKLPPGTIRFIGMTRQRRGGVNGRFVQDPDSKLKRVLVWIPANPDRFKKTIGCGVYDWVRKKGKNTRITAPSDEKYHWIKTVRFYMGPNSAFHALDWHAGFNLKGLYTVTDVIDPENDPNLYDFWVSIKFQGPAYNPGSKKENGIFFERAMLVPVSKKLGTL